MGSALKGKPRRGTSRYKTQYGSTDRRGIYRSSLPQPHSGFVVTIMMAGADPSAVSGRVSCENRCSRFPVREKPPASAFWSGHGAVRSNLRNHNPRGRSVTVRVNPICSTGIYSRTLVAHIAHATFLQRPNFRICDSPSCFSGSVRDWAQGEPGYLLSESASLV